MSNQQIRLLAEELIVLTKLPITKVCVHGPQEVGFVTPDAVFVVNAADIRRFHETGLEVVSLTHIPGWDDIVRQMF
ncbi:hypothetical protein [Thalassospira lucentensis]|uniref:hypothetical protein n=1 Tax=Thalassospira lucentensis TaxID=168935 RepID=UPI002943CD83|nr:hypothetical protein [Thalassospira lucentensis]WOI09034.1 hypothetical protein R1T41_00125 [Thalassospira lucentensis]